MTSTGIKATRWVLGTMTAVGLFVLMWRQNNNDEHCHWFVVFRNQSDLYEMNSCTSSVRRLPELVGSLCPRVTVTPASGELWSVRLCSSAPVATVIAVHTEEVSWRGQ